VTRPLSVFLLPLLLYATTATAPPAELLQIRADKGEAAAQLELGLAYFHGRGGVLRDFGQAFHWFRLAAEQGDPKGETNLGSLYFHGKGTRQDFVKAKEWFRKAGSGGAERTV